MMTFLRAIHSIVVRVGIGILLVSNTGAFADDQGVPQEYQIKAAFLLKFINFIEWQGELTAPKTICVFGDNPFGDTLEQIIAVHDLSLSKTKVVKTYNMQELRACNIVYISQSEQGSVHNVLEKLQSLPIITVSDIDSFARTGGTIEFVLDGSRISFIINQKQAKDDGIKISSQLLSLAKNLIQGS